MNKKALILLIIGFLIGFFSHAFFTPDLFTNGIFILPQASLSQSPNTSQSNNINNETLISYDGKKFSRTNVKIEASRYISIVNDSQYSSMDIVSSQVELTTPRPYAYKESLRTRIDKPGQYIVADRANPDIRMVITVK